MRNTESLLAGVILGTALGDSIGLPAEGLSPKTIRRRWAGRWRQGLVFGRGLVSDDTEHTLFVAQSLLEHPDDPEAFQRALAWRLRWWLLALPAGVGFATARAIFKLWLGFAPSRSGVFSAGNGPAMRSAIIGAFFPADALRRRLFVSASTRLTHTDPQAEIAALAVAELVAGIARGKSANEPWPILETVSEDARWQTLVAKMRLAHESGRTVTEFATDLGLERGVTGYALHTVPVAIYAWASFRGDFRGAVEAALNCGGDTDTVGAITGALAGAETGPPGLPADWLDKLVEWPRTKTWMRQLSARLAAQAAGPSRERFSAASPAIWFGTLPRNVAFLIIVLAHGFARPFLR